MGKQDMLLFDKRLIERHIKSGAVTRKQYEEFLANIEDAREKAESLSMNEDRKGRNPAPRHRE